jgi:hypothetical protein
LTQERGLRRPQRLAVRTDAAHRLQHCSKRQARGRQP